MRTIYSKDRTKVIAVIPENEAEITDNAQYTLYIVHKALVASVKQFKEETIPSRKAMILERAKNYSTTLERFYNIMEGWNIIQEKIKEEDGMRMQQEECG